MESFGGPWRVVGLLVDVWTRRDAEVVGRRWRRRPTLDAEIFVICPFCPFLPLIP